MSYIAWDTETTGLPMTRDRATPDNVHLFDKCRMVSIACVKYSSHGRELGSHHSIVYPDTYEVTASEIHGITHEDALANGFPFLQVYNKFVDAIKESGSKIMVAHNSEFDENVLFSECYRRGISTEPFKDVTFVCTLDMTRRIFMTSMKLIILYEKLTGEVFKNAHNALADSRACGVVYPILRDKKLVHKNIGVPKIVLKASDVAAMIGRNRYKKPNEVANNLWAKYSPKTFKGQTVEQIALSAISECPVSKSLLIDTQKFKSTDSSSVEQKYRAVTRQLVDNCQLESSKMNAVRDHLRKTLYTEHGISHEDKTAEMNPNFIRDDTFYKYKVCTIEGTVYELVGRVDRLVKDIDGNLTIVEIKNRANGLFRNVRDYENIQCQTYMEMLNLNSCQLIEQYNEKSGTYHILRNKEEWDTEILPKLKHFCEYFHGELSN